MWKNKVLVIYFCFLVGAINAQNMSGGMNTKVYGGPLLGLGFSGGNGQELDYPAAGIENHIGFSSRFGGMVQYMHSIRNGIGIGLVFEQNNRRVNLHQPRMPQVYVPITEAKIRDEHLSLPIEAIHTFSHFRRRFYVTAGPVISFNTLKTLLYSKLNQDADSATSILVNQKTNYSKFSLGFTIKAGIEFPLGLKETGKVYVDYMHRNWFGNAQNKTAAYGFFLVGQYCWGS